VWVFWDDVVGAAVAARAQPAGFRDGVLSVRVGGAAWMQELQFMKEDVRERLNARLGAELIRDIYFISGVVEPRRPAPPPAATAIEDTEPVELPPIRDARLAEVFERIARRHQGRRRT
jgi:predicted nucleic acid-binding Zn ribbon protein